MFRASPPAVRSLVPFVCLAVTSAASGQSAATSSDLQTRAERTGYEETSSYDDVMSFVRQVADISPRIRLTRFGSTVEGRELPLVVVGDVDGVSAEAVRASGKTRVFVQANIHAGEVCGKEAMLMWLRAVARGEYGSLFDSLVVLVAPIYNADGNERVALTNRPRQHGPLRGMGQRPNAQGYDLNRDHIKLDSPEAEALVGLLDAYDPHVGIDLHTTNGTRHGYHLTYSPPLHPNTDAAILAVLTEEWLPHAAAHLRERSGGWESFDYGNAFRPRGASERGWYTFDHRPRFNNNYVGLRNRFAILSEAYAYATFEDRVWATYWFVEGALDFAAVHATRVRQVTAAADARRLVGAPLAVRAQHRRAPEPVTILMGAVAEERNPYSDSVILRRQPVLRPEPMPVFIGFEPTETADVPLGYLIPAGATEVLATLAKHGVRYEPAEPSLSGIPVEVFVLDSTTVAERPFQRHRERTVWGRYRRTVRPLAEGTVVVMTDQPLGRLAFTLLEPRSDDGLANWNALDRLLESAPDEYPVWRLIDDAVR